jgi:hypothetical protein
LTDVAEDIVDALDWVIDSRRSGDSAEEAAAVENLRALSRLYPLEYMRVSRALRGELNGD